MYSGTSLRMSCECCLVVAIFFSLIKKKKKRIEICIFAPVRLSQISGSLLPLRPHLLLTLLCLGQESFVNVWKNTTSSDGSTDQRVKFLITTNSQLQVTGCNTLHFKVLGGIACQFEHFGCQVFEDSSRVDGSLGTDTDMVLSTILQVAMNTADRELQASASRARQCWDLLTALFYNFLSGGGSFGSKVCVGLSEVVQNNGKKGREKREEQRDTELTVKKTRSLFTVDC